MQLQSEINTHKIVFKKRENKTKQNKEQLKWKVEQGILCKNVVSCNNDKNKNHFSYLVHIKVAIMISLMFEEKRERSKESICLYLDM